MAFGGVWRSGATPPAPHTSPSIHLQDLEMRQGQTRSYAHSLDRRAQENPAGWASRFRVNRPAVWESFSGGPRRPSATPQLFSSCASISTERGTLQLPRPVPRHPGVSRRASRGMLSWVLSNFFASVGVDRRTSQGPKAGPAGARGTASGVRAGAGRLLVTLANVSDAWILAGAPGREPGGLPTPSSSPILAACTRGHSRTRSIL